MSYEIRQSYRNNCDSVFWNVKQISRDTVSKIQWFSLRNRYLIKRTGTPFIQDEICQNNFLQQFV